MKNLEENSKFIDTQLQNYSLNLLPRQIKYRLSSIEAHDLSCKYKPLNETVEMIQFRNSFREFEVEKPVSPQFNGELIEQFWRHSEKRGNTPLCMIFVQEREERFIVSHHSLFF